jgi:hypothetical protein
MLQGFWVELDQLNKKAARKGAAVFEAEGSSS